MSNEVQIVAPHNGEKLPIYPKDFTYLCFAVHKFNTQWWLDPKTGERKDRNMGEMLMLMTSELSEALEADRKDYMDDKLSQYHGVDVELVDCIIRAMDLLGARHVQRLSQYTELKAKYPDGNFEELCYSPGAVFADKCLYNSNRADHRPENRVKPGGKAY